ncbi:unnamed protein product [Ectocarpus fasciculatus]
MTGHNQTTQHVMTIFRQQGGEEETNQTRAGTAGGVSGYSRGTNGGAISHQDSSPEWRKATRDRLSRARHSPHKFRETTTTSCRSWRFSEGMFVLEQSLPRRFRKALSLPGTGTGYRVSYL